MPITLKSFFFTLSFFFLLLAASLAVRAQEDGRTVTIFGAGDSTAAKYPENHAPMMGWMQSLADFTVNGAVVEDRAVGGRSTKSFRDEGRWDRILADLKPGDFVLIQFGHNDQKQNRPEIYAEAHSDFKANLTRFVKEVREKGGKPILLTSVSRRLFDASGKLTVSLGDYPECTREVARETETPLVDLNRLTRAWIEAAGPEGSKRFFLNLEPGEEPNYPEGNSDNSHFHRNGARAVVQIFIEDAQRQGLEVGKYFKPEKETSSTVLPKKL